MARKLVSIRRISSLRHIPGNTRLQIAVVDGWTCSVRAGEFTKDELVVFFEIDSFLPPPTEDPRYGTTYNPTHNSTVTWKGSKGIHVKSIMMPNSSDISQGLVLKLKAFPEVNKVYEDCTDELGAVAGEEKAMGFCFAEMVGVKKWQLDNIEAKGVLGRPPVFFPDTHIERVQNLKTLFTPKYAKAVYQQSIKMDGSSMTVYYIKKDTQFYLSLPALPEGCKGELEHGRIGVCSRNTDLAENGGSLFWDVAVKNGLPQKLARVGRNIAIQGELCGSTIQQNRHGYSAGFHDFFVFSIFDIDRQERMTPAETVLRAKQLGLQHVPVLGEVRLHEIAGSVEDLLKQAEGAGINGKKREGLVFKNVEDGRWFKVIANNYLLKHGE